VTAAIGLLVGAGFFFLAIAATVATIIVLVPLRWVEEYLARGATGGTEGTPPEHHPTAS
jgi:uncharacterized membrane protein YhiD involved in acid resistance